MNRPLRPVTRGALAIAAVTALSVIGACSGDTDPGAEPETAGDTVAECQVATPSGAFTWTDGLGNTITLDQVPSTVVAQTSVAAGLWDAGYQVDGVFGETDTSTPGTASQLGRVDLGQVDVIGSTWGEFDVDSYARMEPDLLLDYVFDGAYWYVPSKQQKQIEKLAPIGGVNGQPSSIDDAIDTYIELASKLGADTRCNDDLKEAQSSYETALDAVRENAGHLEVLVASASTDLFYVVNPDQLPETQTLADAGVDVIGPKKDNGRVFEDYSWEEIAQFADADVILMDGRNTDDVRTGMESIPTWTNLPAVQADQVYTWHAGSPYSYQQYTQIFAELADELAAAEDLPDTQ